MPSHICEGHREITDLAETAHTVRILTTYSITNTYIVAASICHREKFKQIARTSTNLCSLLSESLMLVNERMIKCGQPSQILDWMTVRKPFGQDMLHCWSKLVSDSWLDMTWTQHKGGLNHWKHAISLLSSMLTSTIVQSPKEMQWNLWQCCQKTDRPMTCSTNCPWFEKKCIIGKKKMFQFSIVLWLPFDHISSFSELECNDWYFLKFVLVSCKANFDSESWHHCHPNFTHVALVDISGSTLWLLAWCSDWESTSLEDDMFNPENEWWSILLLLSCSSILHHCWSQSFHRKQRKFWRIWNDSQWGLYKQKAKRLVRANIPTIYCCCCLCEKMK